MTSCWSAASRLSPISVFSLSSALLALIAFQASSEAAPETRKAPLRVGEKSLVWCRGGSGPQPRHSAPVRLSSRKRKKAPLTRGRRVAYASEDQPSKEPQEPDHPDEV
jgi:hypothetical protein